LVTEFIDAVTVEQWGAGRGVAPRVHPIHPWQVHIDVCVRPREVHPSCLRFHTIKKTFI